MLTDTSAAHRTAKATAAHHSLQHALLSLEFSESMKRMQVELEMSHKEVEVLQAQAQRGNASITTPVQPGHRLSSKSPDDQRLTILRDRCKLLELENDDLVQRQENLKALMLERETQSQEEIERLKDRIRENRKHVNLLRHSSGNVEGSPFSSLNTPNIPTARKTRHENGSAGRYTTPKARGTDAPFAALLLADQVLSQGAATSPSTPAPHPGNRQGGGGGSHHHRGSHSLSSLPSTPLQARSVPTAIPHTPYYSLQKPRSPLAPQTAPPRSIQSTRRRESRDSTISASDLDVEDAAEQGPGYRSEGPLDDSGPEDHTEIPESQASQEARHMLKKSASRSFQDSSSSSFQQQQWARDMGSPPSKNSNSTAKGGANLKQSKIQGKVTKPGLGIEGVGLGGSKRKVADRDVSAGSAGHLEKRGKRGRFGSEGVGLGIGGWASSPRT